MAGSPSQAVLEILERARGLSAEDRAELLRRICECTEASVTEPGRVHRLVELRGMWAALNREDAQAFVDRERDSWS